MLRHELEADELEESAVVFLAIVGGEEEAADLAGAVVFFDQVKSADFFSDLEHLRFEDLGFDLVSVEGIEPPYLGDDAGSAGDSAGGC